MRGVAERAGGAGPAIREQAHAKLNLVLEVIGRRPDGYHEIRSVVAPLRLADTVTVRPAGDLRVTVEPPGALPEGDTLALEAAARLREAAGRPGLGAHIHIRKQIPVAAGLGGGSADAAAALRALNRLWGLDWPFEVLAEVGLRVGADVPACLLGRTALIEGIGERVKPLPPAPPVAVVLATPAVDWSGPKTATVYRAYRPPGQGARAGPAAEALEARDLPRLLGAVANDLEPGAVRLAPAIAEIRAALRGAGAAAVAMAGAGPTVFALCPEPERVPAVAAAGRRLGAGVRVTALLGE